MYDQARDQSPECTAYSVEAEQAVIGALTMSPDAIAVVEAAGGADLFYDPLHARMFEAMQRMQREGAMISPVTMTGRFRDELDAQQLGAGYIVRLAGAALPASTVPGYCDMLADLRDKRRIHDAVERARLDISAGDEPAATIAARLDAAVSGVGLSASRRPVTMGEAVTSAMTASFAAYHGESTGAIGTGIRVVDRILGGLYPGDLALLGGRPSMGKTALALSFALNMARAGKSVVIASLEMTPEAMALRAVSEATAQGRQSEAVTYHAIRRGDMSERGAEAVARAAKEVAELPITFLTREHSDIGAMVAGVRHAAKRQNVDLVVVDYLQLLRSHVRGNTNDQVSDISRSLKALAMQIEAPVLALSQLSRALESRNDKRPQLSDLRDSGSIEQDADVVMFCYRHEYYLSREEPEVSDGEAHGEWSLAMERARNRMDLIVAKQRQGEIGTARIRCNPALNLIWED